MSKRKTDAEKVLSALANGELRFDEIQKRTRLTRDKLRNTLHYLSSSRCNLVTCRRLAKPLEEHFYKRVDENPQTRAFRMFCLTIRSPHGRSQAL